MVGTIINSDDFGYSPEVNQATCLAFKRGLISSTTALVNFDIGFQDARRLVAQGEIPRSSIGIHLNLSEGRPLSSPIQWQPRFCEDGIFHGRLRVRPIFAISKGEAEAVAIELEAQLLKFQEFGFLPTHIDSHHHVHTEWGLLGPVTRCARKYGIRSIRPARNLGAIGIAKSVYKRLLNLRLSSGRFLASAYFGDLDDVMYMGTNITDMEVMVHARMQDGCLTDLDGCDLEAKIARAFPAGLPKLSGYSGNRELR